MTTTMSVENIVMRGEEDVLASSSTEGDTTVGLTSIVVCRGRLWLFDGTWRGDDLKRYDFRNVFIRSFDLSKGFFVLMQQMIQLLHDNDK